MVAKVANKYVLVIDKTRKNIKWDLWNIRFHFLRSLRQREQVKSVKLNGWWAT